MTRTKTKNITDRFKRMRKCKIIELLTSPEIDLTSPEIDLTPEEMNVFLLRLTNSNDGVSDKVYKCPRCVTKIFMNVINKLKDFYDEKDK